jgi:hypothetical protein
MRMLGAAAHLRLNPGGKRVNDHQPREVLFKMHYNPFATSTEIAPINFPKIDGQGEEVQSAVSIWLKKEPVRSMLLRGVAGRCDCAERTHARTHTHTHNTHLSLRSLGMNEGPAGANAEAAPRNASITIFLSILSESLCRRILGSGTLRASVCGGRHHPQSWILLKTSHRDDMCDSTRCDPIKLSRGSHRATKNCAICPAASTSTPMCSGGAAIPRLDDLAQWLGPSGGRRAFGSPASTQPNSPFSPFSPLRTRKLLVPCNRLSRTNT